MTKYIETLLAGEEVEWKTLGEVAMLSNTGVDKKIIEGERLVKLLNFVDVFHLQHIYSSTPRMDVSASEKKIRDCNILKGDVFVTPSSEIKDEIGYSAVAVEDCPNSVYSYHIMRIRVHDTEFLDPHFLNYLFNVSSTKSEQSKLCVQCSLYIDTRLLWKQAIGSDGPQ